MTERKKIIVTTSWDDGDARDLRVAELLARYGLQGTFYAHRRDDAVALSRAQILELGRSFEIGAHSITHPDLRQLNDAELQNEVAGSKKYLQDLLGKEIKMFCYPKGLYSDRVVTAVRDAGFLGARTVEKYFFAPPQPQDFFTMGVTVQAYPWPLRKKDAENFLWGRHLFQPIASDFGKFLQTAPHFRAFVSWQEYARHLFLHSREHGGYFHLWGHSWEIEKYGMWGELEEFLRYIASFNDCAFVSNKEIVE